MSFLSLLVASLFWFFPASVWSNLASKQNVITESGLVWPTDPICGFVAATNIAVLYPKPQWSCNMSGATNSDPCTWEGITCSQSNQITNIVIQGDNVTSLTGTLTPTLGDIPTLVYISIYLTRIFGTLPSSWSSLTALETIDLIQNSLTGTLPSSWNSLSGMRSLYLYQNSLSGTLPFSWSSLTSMGYLFLNQNSLSGTLPSSWSSLTSMGYLFLSQNALSGTLPSSWSSLLGMEMLYLSQNSLSGTLPSSWSSLTSIGYLFLSQNALSGTLPSSWSSLTGMYYLDVTQNSLSCTLPSSWSSLTGMLYLGVTQNSLSGTLPSSWSSLLGVEMLYLSQNSLSGTLPSSWSSLTGMNDLDLHQNLLSGTLSSSWNSFSGLRFLYLYQNSLSGTLPSSWISMVYINWLDLHQNSLSGTLPSSWSSLTGMYYLDVSHNYLSGTLPSSWSSLTLLNTLYLYQNSLSGTLPSSWSSLTSIYYMSLSQNCLNGQVSSSLSSMHSLQYLYLSDNSFSGQLPTTWTSNVLRTIDMNNNAFTGSLHTEVSSYPAALSWLNVAFNSLSGTVPSVVALFGNMSYLNVSHNNAIVGSIPSEFCSSAGVSIDVEGTGIDCYSGCLTSSYILVEGASPNCHDGSIMKQFVLITGVLAVVAIVCTALYRLHKWWWPIFVSLGSRMSCSSLDMFSSPTFSSLRRLVFGARRRRVSAAAPDKSSLSYTVLGMAVVKFLLGLVVPLTLNNWWTYGYDHDIARNNEVLVSCSNPTVGNCFSYCGDVHVVTVNITTDDVVFDDHITGVPTAHSVPHFQSDSYCTAMLPGYCGYEVWMDLKLPPILFHLLGLMMQVILWRFGSVRFSVTPQKAQYDLILSQLYPEIFNLSDSNKTVRTAENNRALPPEITLASRVVLLRQLATPLFPCIFWFLELVTVIYVWGELVFPPVYCGSVPPLSLYYYPILMSLLDLMKLNIYTSVELWQASRYVESVFVLFDLQLFATHLWVTVAMGLIFGAGVIRDCALGVWWYMEIAMGRHEKLEWATGSKPAASAAVEIALANATTTTISSSTPSDVTSNPILLGVNSKDVESAGSKVAIPTN